MTNMAITHLMLGAIHLKQLSFAPLLFGFGTPHFISESSHLSGTELELSGIFEAARGSIKTD